MAQLSSWIRLCFSFFLNRTSATVPELPATPNQQRLQAFQQTAQKDLSNKEGELLQPIIDKAKKAIDEVAAENNFTYVFDMSMGAILYHSEQSVDMLPLVLKKLGIK